MSDMKSFLAPKTDQLNFDHFSGGRSVTIKVTDVKFTTGDQPVTIVCEGAGGKVFRPCKSMGRVLSAGWGEKASNYIGKSLTLYGDPSVIFAGQKVGGVRISHMSDIKQDLIIALTASKGNRKPYTVKPLQAPAAETAKTESAGQ
jgi:hypothetical protein